MEREGVEKEEEEDGHDDEEAKDDEYYDNEDYDAEGEHDDDDDDDDEDSSDSSEKPLRQKTAVSVSDRNTINRDSIVCGDVLNTTRSIGNKSIVDNQLTDLKSSTQGRTTGGFNSIDLGHTTSLESTTGAFNS